MKPIAKQLVNFDASYYSYPRNISRGFYGSYPIESDLTDHDRERRRQWLELVDNKSLSKFHKMVFKIFIASFDFRPLKYIIESHGIFAEKFFHSSIRESVTRNFANADIDLLEFQKLLSEAMGYSCHVSGKSGAIDNILNHIYEQTLAEILSDPPLYNQISCWFDEFKKQRTCELCGNRFRVIDLPDWIYYGSNGFKSCCFQCNIVTVPRKKELYHLIPLFVDSCGFIPRSDISPINLSFTSRLSAERWAKAVQSYARIGGIDYVKEIFGSWFIALAETGVLPDGTLSTARGIRCLAQDRHVCHSLEEQQIDDWLFSHDLPHEREPYYPFHSTFNSTGRRRADWKVENMFIEYFGLVGTASYDKKIDEKLLLAQHFNIDLISIYPSDLGYLDQKLAMLINKAN